MGAGVDPPRDRQLYTALMPHIQATASSVVSPVQSPTIIACACNSFTGQCEHHLVIFLERASLSEARMTIILTDRGSSQRSTSTA